MILECHEIEQSEKNTIANKLVSKSKRVSGKGTDGVF